MFWSVPLSPNPLGMGAGGDTRRVSCCWLVCCCCCCSAACDSRCSARLRICMRPTRGSVTAFYSPVLRQPAAHQCPKHVSLTTRHWSMGHSPSSMGQRASLCWVRTDGQALWPNVATHPPTPPAPQDRGWTPTWFPVPLTQSVHGRVTMHADSKRSCCELARRHTIGQSARSSPDRRQRTSDDAERSRIL